MEAHTFQTIYNYTFSESHWKNASTVQFPWLEGFLQMDLQ